MEHLECLQIKGYPTLGVARFYGLFFPLLVSLETMYKEEEKKISTTPAKLPV